MFVKNICVEKKKEEKKNKIEENKLQIGQLSYLFCEKKEGIKIGIGQQV